MYHVSSQKANSFPDIPADVLPALWHIARFVSVKALTHTHTNSASHTPTQTQTQIFPFHAHCAARTVYIKVLIRVSPEELKCISVAKSCSLACESCSLRGGSRPSEIPLAHGTRQNNPPLFSSDPTGGAFLRLLGKMSAAIRNERKKRWSLMDKWDLKLAVLSTFCQRCRFTILSHTLFKPAIINFFKL